MLGMYVNEPVGERLDDRQGHRLIVDERTGASGTVKDTADSYLTAVPIQVGRLHPLLKLRVLCYAEESLNHTGVTGLPYHGRLRLGTKHERKGAEKNGLSGSRLACNNHKTRRKINLQRVYQDVISYF